MERRKFIAGLGSLTAAGAAGIGTGAFTSVTADRDVDVEVAGDANAYLGLKKTSSPNSQQYVQKSSGEISINFSSSNPNTSNNSGTGDLGNGFNPDAVTKVNDLLKVTNQGTQTVDFYVDLTNLSTGGAGVTLSADDDQGNDVSGNVIGSSNSVSLSAGESIVLDLEVDTSGQGKASTSGTITFVAEA